MIPDKLTIEGLYSYQERQTIDFGALIDAGLFGVFGSVGSGKSSILEAITFALFGKTERLNERGDSRNYNMMNLKSNRTYIEFDFYNFENRYFRITREYRRHKNKFREVQAETPVFYEQLHGQWIPLEHTDVEPLIGLSYTNFKRTIIIPQGQFKEFLELGNRDRTQMMKEIFNLYRFDLQDKVAQLNKKNQSQLDTLNGQLSNYEEVTAELIEAETQLLNDEQKQLYQKEQTYKLVHDKFQLLKNLKADVEELTKRKTELATVAAREPEIEELKKRFQQYEQTRQVFYQLLIDRKRLMKELDQHKTDFQQQQELRQHLTTAQTELQQQFDRLKIESEKIEIKKAEADDLSLLVKIRDLTDIFAQKQLQITQAGAAIEKFDVQLKKRQENLETNLSETELLRSKKLDSKLLMDVAAWFSEQHRLQKDSAKTLLTIQATTQEITQIDKELENVETNPEGKIRLKEEEKKDLQKVQSQLEVQQKLAEYAHALHDGEPCPLCGSTAHPNVVEHKDLSQDIAHIDTQLAACDQAIAEIREAYNNNQQLIARKSVLAEQVQKSTAEAAAIINQVDTHRKQFVWEQFDPDNPEAFDDVRQNNLQQEKDIREKEQLSTALRKQFEDERKKLEQLHTTLNQLKLQEREVSAQIKNNKSHLRVLSYADTGQMSTAALQKQHHELLQHIRHTEQAFAKVTEDLNNNRTKLAAQESLTASTSKHIDKLEKQLETVQEQVSQALAQHHFDDIEQVRTILAWQMDTEATRNTLENYKIKLESLRSIVQTLESKLQQAQFDEVEFISLGQQVDEMALQVKTSTETVARIDANARRMAKQFEDKKELLLQQEKLQKRSDNLKVMTRLFKGQGFVEYVSSIFLRQLCDHANIRFRRMTRNQLSLSINQENDFEIIDYLNEGKSRNVKTLSGGQAFQVSLSLALALAESVQSHAKADKNFFFIDEGFGTQDSESVNMVFETLLSLQKENRIVGIISHVEELKERIPAAIHIRKDEERGSLIALG